MKLNESFLSVYFELDPYLKNFYLQSHLDIKHKPEVEHHFLLSKIFSGNYDESITNPWEDRKRMANSLVLSPKNLKRYYITKSVEDEANKIKYDKIDLKWFNQLPSMNCIYTVNKNEFYRFEVIEKQRINILNFRQENGYINYDSYSIILNSGILATYPTQKVEFAEKFIRLLLFIELGEISVAYLKPHGKVTYGKKGDDKVKNETGLEFTVVNSNWNKIIIVEGKIPVQSYWRVQRYGKGRQMFKLIQVSDYVRKGYTRLGGGV